MDWEQIARTIAPTLATGLLGPLGGVVTNIAADFLFPPSTDKTTLTPQSVMTKIATMTDPADVAKLAGAELAVRKFEADNNFRFAQMDAESQQNARSMRVTTLAGGNQTADRLAWLSLISFLFVAALVLLIVGLALGNVVTFDKNPEVWAAVSGLIGSVLGYFSANANQVVSFYFGSSAGSAAKTDQMAQHAQDALAALGRLAPRQSNASAPQPAGGPVTRVDSPDGTTTTVATGEPEAKELVRRAGTAASPPSAQAEQRWNDCVAFVLAKEGGFADNPADPGRATNHGITLNTLAHARGTSVTVDDVHNLTEAEAKQIYQTSYWDLVRCDDLPAGVDLCAFDSAVLCGPGTAARFLQTAAGLSGADVDGRVGSQTLSAIGSRSPREIIDQIATIREQYHQKRAAEDHTQQQFLQGWLDRVKDMRATSLQMADRPVA